MADHLLDAVAMSRAVLSDPQFSFPALPRLVPGLVTVPTGEGLIVEGGPARQSFQGSAARHLPRVMAVLDGERDVDGLAQLLELEPSKLWPILSLLYTTGLLEDATGAASADDPAHAFYARSIDTTRVNRSGAEAVARVTGSTVRIVAGEGSTQLAGELARLLGIEGVGTVDHDAAGEPVDSTVDLLVAVGEGPEVEATALEARAAGVLTLPVLARNGTLSVGPVLDASHSACASCAFDQRRRAHGDSDRDADRDADHAEPDAGPAEPDAGPRTPHRWQRTAALLVVRDVLTFLSRVGTASAERFLVTTRLADHAQTSSVVVPDPTCPVCMDPPADLDPSDYAGGPRGLPIAWVHAHSVSFPPRDTINPKDHQVHYQSGNIALQRRHREWPAARRIVLPTTVPDEPSGLTIERVGDVLVRTLGLRNGPTASDSRVDRWCATGGNLGSPTGYLVARAVEGLSPGVYGFQRSDASLALLGWADPHAPLAGVPDEVPAVIVLTGALDTVATKYGSFGWRIIHLDAGVATAQAHLIARSHGLRVQPVPAWDDEALADLLATTSECEPVTAVLTIDNLTATQNGADR